jgi:DNA-binding NarL/FixJ family response regulator
MPQPKAFIVEDSVVIRENLISALEELVPLKVVGWADNEAAAVSWLTEPGQQCDLAIIDIFLRGGSGTGILKSMQAAGSTVERVVLTNYASPDLARQCLAAGASRVFDKSRDIEALISYCQSLNAAAPAPD